MNESEGMALVQRWRDSGLSANRYCQVHNVGIHRLRYWTRRLKSRESQKKAVPPFVLLTPELSEPRRRSEGTDTASDSVEITVGERMSIRMPAQSDHLGAVLRTVKEIME